MLFDAGFLGTRAAMYMDIATLYFAVLPLLLGLSIRFAVIGNIRCHMRSQIAILALTVAVVLMFEIGVRVDGGFVEYIKQSHINYPFFVGFLSVHILIAIASVGGWIYLVVATYRGYVREGLNAPVFQNHKKIGKAIFFAMTLTSVMGCLIYFFLFMM